MSVCRVSETDEKKEGCRMLTHTEGGRGEREVFWAAVGVERVERE